MSDLARTKVKPVPRPGATMLKVARNASSFSRLLNAKLKHGKDGIDLFDLADFCAKHNIDGIDPTGCFFLAFPDVPPDAYTFDLKRNAFEAGVGISVAGARNNFAASDKEKRAADVKIIKDWIVVASKLGAPVLRVFAGTQMRDMTWHDVAKGFTQEQVRDSIADDLRECTERGKEHGVIIGVQKHGDFLPTGDDLIELVGLVDSPWCGAIVDTGYFRSEDPYADMKEAAPYVVNWQVKQSGFGADSDVPRDMKELMRIIRSSGYRGYIPPETLSTPGKEYDSFKVVPPYLEQIRQEIIQTA